MSCYGRAFYEQYKRRLKYDPIGALHFLRKKKDYEIRKIDLTLAAYGLVRQEAQGMRKEERN